MSPTTHAQEAYSTKIEFSRHIKKNIKYNGTSIEKQSSYKKKQQQINQLKNIMHLSCLVIINRN